MNEFEFILYVADQERSKTFYQRLLQIEPTLDVPGMTEFELAHAVKLGLMPENGIAKILRNRMPHPNSGTGIPRCELYLRVAGAKNYMDRGIELGGRLIDELKSRDWGDKVGYLADLDGHVLAFVEQGEKI